MKTILTATNFSEIGNNAVKYAAYLALATNAKLQVFHAYHEPVLISEHPMVTSKEDFLMEESSNDQLEQLLKNIILEVSTELEVEYLSIAGYASEEIADITKEKYVDLIVIGSHDNQVSRKYFGNNLIDILRHSEAPVLVIPKHVQFDEINSIVLGFDFHEIKDPSIFKPLNKMASLFDAKVLVYNIQGEKHPNSLKEMLSEGIKLEHVFENTDYSFSLAVGDKIVEAIIKFTEERKAGMITMIKRHHSILQRLFNESNTEQMALQTKVPLLILRDEK